MNTLRCAFWAAFSSLALAAHVMISDNTALYLFGGRWANFANRRELDVYWMRNAVWALWCSRSMMHLPVSYFALGVVLLRNEKWCTIATCGIICDTELNVITIETFLIQLPWPLRWFLILFANHTHSCDVCDVLFRTTIGEQIDEVESLVSTVQPKLQAGTDNIINQMTFIELECVRFCYDVSASWFTCANITMFKTGFHGCKLQHDQSRFSHGTVLK